MADLVDEVAGFDIRAQLERLWVPALVVCGEGDIANRPLCEDLAARIPHAQFTTIPGAGHVANLDSPRRFTAVMTDFLQQHGC